MAEPEPLPPIDVAERLLEDLQVPLRPGPARRLVSQCIHDVSQFLPTKAIHPGDQGVALVIDRGDRVVVVVRHPGVRDQVAQRNELSFCEDLLELLRANGGHVVRAGRLVGGVRLGTGGGGPGVRRGGRGGPEALKSVLAGDDGREYRQVAMIDASGKVAAFTGELCIAAAGNIVDEENQFSVQANLMASDTVWPAMAEAYRNSKGDLAERMLAALEAAQNEGGDIRGKQSAALIVVSATSTGKSWIDRSFDLRIEDHPEPIKELRRLVTLQRAYQHMNEGDLAVEHGDFSLAAIEYAAAEKLAPHIVEIPFWTAISLASSGKLEQSLPIFRKVFRQEPVWAKLIQPLVDSKLLRNDKELIRKILEQVP